MSSAIVKELPELVENNVISAETAKAIENYYATRRGSGNQMLIFGSLGAILVGLGIILIFAHNWDNFTRSTKTILAMLPLVLFQALTGFSVVKDKPRIWKEVCGTLLFFSVGAAMALISQVYNIPGEESTFLLTWILLGFPLMYILRADSLAILHLVFSTFYAVSTGFFQPDSPWMYLAFMGGFIPYYLQQLRQGPESYSASIFNWLVPLSLTISLGAFITGADEFGIVIYLTFLCLLYNIGLIPYFAKYTYGWNGYLNLGRTGIALLLLGTSFRWFWKAAISAEKPDYYYILLCVVFFAGAIYFAYKASKGIFKFDLYQAVIIIFPIIYSIGMFDDHIPAILNNILVLALGIVAIRQGAARFDFSMLNFGLITIAALIIARFFDTNMTFAVRGLLFIAVGAGFFIANHLVAKKKNRITKSRQ